MTKLKSKQIVRFYVGERDADNKDMSKRNIAFCVVDKALGRKLGMKVSTSYGSGSINYKNGKLYKYFTTPSRTLQLISDYDHNRKIKPGHYKVVIE